MSGLEKMFDKGTIIPSREQLKKTSLLDLKKGIPKIFDESIIDEWIDVRADDAKEWCKNLAKKGIFVGQSSGANLAGISEVIKNLGGCRGSLLSRLSGSGATCFGLFEHDTDAKDAALSLAKKYPHWWVQATPLLNSWKRF